MEQGYANGSGYTSHCPFCDSRAHEDDDPVDLELLNEDTDMNDYTYTAVYGCPRCGKVHVEVFNWEGWEEINEHHPQWDYYQIILKAEMEKLKREATV
jgi:hypothetical protein